MYRLIEKQLRFMVITLKLHLKIISIIVIERQRRTAFFKNFENIHETDDRS